MKSSPWKYFLMLSAFLISCCILACIWCVDWPIMLVCWLTNHVRAQKMRLQDWDAKGLCASTSYSPLLSALESLGLCDTKYCTFKPHPRVERVWWLSVVDIHCWVAWCNLRNVIRGIQLVAGPTHLLLLALLQIHWQFEILDQKMEVKLWNQALKSIDPLCLNVGEKWRLMSWKWMPVPPFSSKVQGNTWS